MIGVLQRSHDAAAAKVPLTHRNLTSTTDLSISVYSNVNPIVGVELL